MSRITFLLVALLVRVQPLSITQHTALMDVYNGLGCNAAVCPRFASSENCTGLSLICSGDNVIRLYLNNKQLTGSIPSSIGQLTALDTLYLNINQLTGSIPSSIGQLTTLSYLYSNNNQLAGSIPSSIGHLTALSLLALNNNQLTGSIPPSIGQLTALNTLYLHYNQLTGSAPPFAGSVIVCYLQLTDAIESNCLNCSTKPATCICVMRTCTPMPIASTSQPTTTQRTIPSTSSVATPSSPVTTSQPTTTSSSSSASTSTVSSFANSTMQIVNNSSSIINTTSTTAGSHGYPPSSREVDNSALISGVVGGVVAALLVVGLIACIVACNRRKKDGQTDVDAHTVRATPAPSVQSSSNNGRVQSSPSNDSERLTVPSARNHYDALDDLQPTSFGRIDPALQPTAYQDIGDVRANNSAAYEPCSSALVK